MEQIFLSRSGLNSLSSFLDSRKPSGILLSLFGILTSIFVFLSILKLAGIVTAGWTVIHTPFWIIYFSVVIVPVIVFCRFGGKSIFLIEENFLHLK